MPTPPTTAILGRSGSVCCCSATGSRHDEIPIPQGAGAHGGGDAQLLDEVFRADHEPDPLERRAGYRDGLRSVAVGIAANQSLETGLPVRISTFGLPLDSHRHSEAPGS